MRLSIWTAALVALGTHCTGAAGADLAKIDRHIGKEPAYKTPPRYCLLVFGAEAKSRAWLVQDGDVLYVDRNCNGDLTEKDERVAVKREDAQGSRVFEAGDIHDGSLTHTGLSVIQVKVDADYVANEKEFQRVAKSNPQPWTWWLRLTAERGTNADQQTGLPKRIGYIVNGDGLGFLLFGDRPETAPIVHFNGPWSLGLQDWKQRLVAGHKSMLQIGVGTHGIGPGTFAFVLYPDTIPQDAYPRAEISFPPRSPSEKPAQVVLDLKQRC